MTLAESERILEWDLADAMRVYKRDRSELSQVSVK